MSKDDFVGYAVPALTLGLGLIAWEGLVRYFAVPTYLLPAPSLIISTLITDWSTLSASLWVTLSITLKALGITLLLFVILGPFLAIRHLIYLPLRGNIMSAVLYLAGIACIGFAFGLAFLHENPGSRRWLYRPAMSLMSTLILSSLIFYSAATIKKMTWSRG